jgi:hypothetical protein
MGVSTFVAYDEVGDTFGTTRTVLEANFGAT